MADFGELWRSFGISERPIFSSERAARIYYAILKAKAAGPAHRVKFMGLNVQMCVPEDCGIAPDDPYASPAPGGFADAAMVDVESSLTPETLPLVPIIDPGMSESYYHVGRASRFVLNSSDELSTLLSSMPQKSSQVWGLPSLSANYQYLVFSDVGQWRPGTARIVGVEERPDMRVVHTVRWLGRENSGNPSDPHGVMHVVAVPRSTTPIAFARTKEIRLTPQVIQPSPQVGVPSTPAPTIQDPNQHPRWRAIPNPELDQASIERLVRERLHEWSLSSLRVERRTLQWVEETLGQGHSLNWLSDSEVWVATTEATPTRLDASGQRVPVTGVSPRQVTLLLSIEDGNTFARVGL
jgi:hypothetical protein